MNTQKLPMSLKMVAWIFIFGGVVGIVEMLVALAHLRIFINGSFIAIFAGQGLLRLDRGWRKFVLFGMWFSLIGEVAIGIWFALRPNDFSIGVPFKFAGEILGSVKFPELGWIFLFGVIYSLWELWVLTNPQIQRLFLGQSVLNTEEVH